MSEVYFTKVIISLPNWHCLKLMNTEESLLCVNPFEIYFKKQDHYLNRKRWFDKTIVSAWKKSVSMILHNGRPALSYCS